MSYQGGEIVLYGTEGICTVLGTEEKRFGSEALMYYVLESKNKGSRIFVPFANKTLIDRIRTPLSDADFRSLLKEFLDKDDFTWIENERERKTSNMTLISNGTTAELLLLMKTIQNRRRMLESKGKKLYAHDDRSYREARTLVLAEMTLSLQMDAEAAEQLLVSAWEDFRLAE
jgi:CarD family transcriptional regulator